MRISCLVKVASVLLLAGPLAQPVQAETVCEPCLRASVRHLADPALKGRKCGSAEENAAAQWLAAHLARMGVEGAFGPGRYLQSVDLVTPQVAAPPRLALDGQAWTDGGAILVQGAVGPVAGPLVRVTSGRDAPETVAGTIVFYDHPTPNLQGVRNLMGAGARAVVTAASPEVLDNWDEFAAQPRLPTAIKGVAPALNTPPVLVHARQEVVDALRAAAPGAPMRLDARVGEPLRRTTLNVVGTLPGPASDVVLLTAHYDHLGVRDGLIYPGANDNASGVAAVLEMTRLLKSEGVHRRGVLVAFFGCEEEGGHGSIAFRESPPLPLADIVANINFEMVGQRDPAHPESLALTGWNRSDLGPMLAANGASLAADAYPREMLFERSDNYFLALDGVVAHSVMGWPTPPTYHRPTDVAAAIDFGFLVEAVQSLRGPLRWLLDSEFRPAWAAGRKP